MQAKKIKKKNVSYRITVIAELLSELARREKHAGIFPEPEVDLFMKVNVKKIIPRPKV